VIFHETQIGGVWRVEPERHEDERGFFARTWDPDEFLTRGLTARVAQCSISHNRRRGTLRGMHYQAVPHSEAKLVRCTAGAIFDVALDLRFDSSTYCGWVGVELSAANGSSLYIPEVCAHGFLTLTDNADVAYQISVSHVPEAGRGVRWDDPAFGIDWPEPVVVINARDAAYPDFTPVAVTP
jgi:dTDP-4-dehydrorhamnose 3,5-epimerase